MLLGEPEHDELVALLAGAEDPLISTATLVEVSIVMRIKTGDGGVTDLDELLGAAAVRSVAVDSAQANLAREAFARFGKGRARARLNLGDCFSYALARAMDRPLLFKGDDFGHTDVTPAFVSRPKPPGRTR